jgi:hypothetical protein
MDRVVAGSLGHLETPGAAGAPPALTILAWDAATTGTDAPPVPAWDGPGVPRYLATGPGRRAVALPSERAIQGFDGGRDRGIWWVEDATALPQWEIAAPLRFVLAWWGSTRGLRLTHAAAVAIPGGPGALLVGPGGSGKSTTALACAAAGMDVAGDDYAMVDPGRPWVHSLYRWAKADRRTMHLLPHLPGGEPPPGEDKVLVDVGTVHPDRLVPGFPLVAILAPHLSGAASTSLSPLRPAAAVAAVATSTVLQLPGDSEATLADAARLATRLPSFEVALGRDPLEAAAAIAAHLEGLA